MLRRQQFLPVKLLQNKTKTVAWSKERALCYSMYLEKAVSLEQGARLILQDVTGECREPGGEAVTMK
ncbi:unnamed protein product, partial [Iphiclides podalirius]